MFREMIDHKRYAFCEGFNSWEEAIRASCVCFVKEGIVPEDYADAIIRNVRECGPYIIIMPGLALPHAMHEGVSGTAISFMKTRKPVIFTDEGTEKEAQVFLTIAASDAEKHMHNIQLIAQELEDEEVMAELFRVESEEDLAVLQKHIEDKGLNIVHTS